MGTVTCKKCGKAKDLSCFAASELKPRSKDGYISSRCRDCENERHRKARAKRNDEDRARLAAKAREYRKTENYREHRNRTRNIEKEYQASRTWRQNNPLKAVLCWSKATARKKGYAYDLDLEFLKELYQKQEGKCYWFKTHLALDSSQADTPFRLSIDRLDSSKGYTKDNVVLASIGANLAKSDHNLDMWNLFLEAIRHA